MRQLLEGDGGRQDRGARPRLHRRDGVAHGTYGGGKACRKVYEPYVRALEKYMSLKYEPGCIVAVLLLLLYTSL